MIYYKFLLVFYHFLSNIYFCNIELWKKIIRSGDSKRWAQRSCVAVWVCDVTTAHCVTLLTDVIQGSVFIPMTYSVSFSQKKNWNKKGQQSGKERLQFIGNVSRKETAAATAGKSINKRQPLFFCSFLLVICYLIKKWIIIVSRSRPSVWMGRLPYTFTSYMMN